MIMGNNTQVSQTLMRTDLLPEIVKLQNKGPYGTLKMAPLYTTPTLHSHYRTLRGNGLIDTSSPDYGIVSMGSEPAASKLAYGDQKVDVFLRRHGLVEIDNILMHHLSGQGIDVPSDYLARHVPQAIAVHAAALAARFSSTGADRAFPAGFTLTGGDSPDFTSITASLRKVCDAVINLFLAAGSFGHGDKLVVACNNKVAQALQSLLEISPVQAIASTEGGIGRQGLTTMADVQTFLQTKCNFPLEVEFVVDMQYNLAGNPILADDLYFMVQSDAGKGSFVSTPVLDILPIAGVNPDDIEGLSIGGSPIAHVVEYDTYRVQGRGYYLEQVFGLDFYGSSDAQTDQVLGVRVQSVLS